LKISRFALWFAIGFLSALVLKGKDMGKLHDDLLERARAIRDSAQQAVAAGTEAQQAMTDVYNLLDEALDMLKQFAQDNAAQGGSTGGGSGAEQMAAQSPQQAQHGDLWQGKYQTWKA
jgi:hypothetical protein